MPTQQTAQISDGNSSQDDQSPRELTPELIKKVADKVYAMLLADMKIARERKRFTRKPWKTRRSR